MISVALCLQERGGFFKDCRLTPCSDDSLGFGIFVEGSDLSLEQNNPRIVFSVPLRVTLSTPNILRDPFFGEDYRRLLANGSISERTLLMTFFIVEKLRGEGSDWFPYIQMLPSTVKTPISFSTDEVKELEGTTLHGAVSAMVVDLKIIFSYHIY